jgi:hypothetical protein
VGPESTRRRTPWQAAPDRSDAADRSKVYREAASGWLTGVVPDRALDPDVVACGLPLDLDQGRHHGPHLLAASDRDTGRARHGHRRAGSGAGCARRQASGAGACPPLLQGCGSPGGPPLGGACRHHAAAAVSPSSPGPGRARPGRVETSRPVRRHWPPSSMSTLPYGSTRAVWNGCTTIVVSGTWTMAGPGTTLPAVSRSPQRTGVDSKSPSSLQ